MLAFSLPLSPSDLPSAHAIESSSYPPDEAASLRSMSARLRDAPGCFLGARDPENNNKLVGFVNGTRCREFTKESMSDPHDPAGDFLAIHSVAVDGRRRRRGYGSALLRRYLDAVLDDGGDEPPKKIVLIAKARLVGFYVGAGFTFVGPSDIVHGKDPWYDFVLDVEEERERRRHIFRIEKPPPRSFWIADSFVPSSAGEGGDGGSPKWGTGNPASVVYMGPSSGHADEKEREWMQQVAAEFNLSETAFVWDEQNSEGEQEEEATYIIRYFTPTVEVDLCGHATLAAAAVAFQHFLPPLDANIKEEEEEKRKILFLAKGGRLGASTSRRRSSETPTAVKIAMDFPWKDVSEVGPGVRASVVSAARGALGIEPDTVLSVRIGEDGEDVLLEVTPDAFRRISPGNVGLLAEVDGYDRGVIVCCRSEGEGGVDFRSRFFGPKAGIDEDPVTGSAHCLLAPYFGNVLKKKRMVGRQDSPRGGELICTLHEEQRRVGIRGNAALRAAGKI